MTRATVIINPLSGHGRHTDQVQAHAALARSVLRRHDIEAEVRVTTGPGDANRFATEAVRDGIGLVVAWGGDGTINEAACGLVHTATPLAIVPAGSGNGLASDLGVPFIPEQALAIAATGVVVKIDAGQIAESTFFNIAGIGVDAVIAARFAERGLRRRGPLAYLQLGVSELVKYRAQTYSLVIDGEPLEYRAMLLALANGSQYGNRVCIAPGARLDDGLLELVAVDQLPLHSIAWRLPSLFRGTLSPGRGVMMRAVREVEVRAPDRIPFHVDGEPRLGPTALIVRTLPKALAVRVASWPCRPERTQH
jgi:diacylglycerol kinase (ATP)